MLNSKFWDKYFRVYDILNIVIPYQELLQELIDSLDARAGDKVLDAGGGTGNVAVLLAEQSVKVTVFDFSKEALDICKEKNNEIRVILGDLTRKLPFFDSSFDKIISNNTIYSISPEKRYFVMREFYRILKPGGKVVISNIKKGFKPFEIYKDHIRKAIKKDGLLETTIMGFRMLWPTVKMFYYNSRIKKQITQGSYSFFEESEQKELLERGGFRNVSETKNVYSNQAVLNSAIK